jgi:CubicO group peptidase (beta-lactamase class C family)
MPHQPGSRLSLLSSAGPRLALAVLLLAWPASPARALDPAGLDLVLKDALKTFQVPGLAVAIVKNDEVFYRKGVGVRDVRAADAMTPDTVFGIGSLTKAFASASVGILVDEGKADWDDPVRKHLPWFRLADPLADRDVTLRDLLCHRTGLGRHENLWYRAPWSVEESVRRLAYLEPDFSFRSTYRYNNLCYLAAGLAVAATAKMPWHEFVQKRIFEPLDMKNAVFTPSAARKLPDHATPHRRVEGRLEAIPWYNDDNQIRASGSIKTSVRELTKWLRLQLNGGVCDGKRALSARSLAETHSPQVVIPASADPSRLPDVTQVSYGLGWRVYDYRGHALLEHGGAMDGFRARILLLPRDRVGLVLLTNVEELPVLQAAGNTLMDRLLGLPKKEWFDHYAGRRDAPAPRSLPARRPNTRPSHELAAYAGTYQNLAYGTLRITLLDGALQLHWSSYQVPLQHFHFDTFVSRHPERLANELATFALRPDGTVGSVQFLGRTFKRTEAK